jgi:hypothetical protein
VQVTFTGCESATRQLCQNEGASEGVIKAGALEGQLGIIKNTTKRGKLVEASVGWDVKPTVREAGLAAFECGDRTKEAVTQVLVGGDQS